MVKLPGFLLVATLIGYLSYAQDADIPNPPEFPALFADSKWNRIEDSMYKFGNPVKPILTPNIKKDSSIFVTISHYRDARCASTVDYLFKKAKYPNRVNIGIIQQRHTEQDKFNCLDDYCSQFGQQNCLYKDQIHQIEFSHQNSRGPAFARYFQSFLIDNEEFCMQLDSHSALIQDWDIQLIEMWIQTQNENAIISSQPLDISFLNKNNHANNPHLCQATVDESGLIINLPPTISSNLEKPIISPLYSAAFSFGKCHAEQNVPNDPNLQMIFDGDEFSKQIRLWTHGYDVYTPSFPVVFHDYRGTMPLIKAQSGDINVLEWQRNGMTPEFRKSLYDKSVNRINVLLLNQIASLEDDLIQLGKFGLGVKRNLQQFMQFSGINIQARQIFESR